MQIDFGSLASNQRILLVLNGVFNPEGGMYEYAKAWINLLKNHHWNVGISTSGLSLGNDGDVKEFSFESKIYDRKKIYRNLALSSLIGGKEIRELSEKIAQHINEYNPSIVHIVDISLYTGYLIDTLSSTFPNIKLVCTIHDPREHEANISLIVKAWKYHNIKKILNSARRKSNVYLHAHDIRLINTTALAAIERVIAIPHPPPVPIAKRQRPHPHEDIWQGPIQIGFMGRIEPYKGLEILQKSIELILQNNCVSSRSFEITIAGQGSFAVTEWSKLPIKIHLHNEFLTEMEFHNIMANLDLLVLPYLTATQSGVGLMAVSYGIPIVATDVGAINGTVVADGENGVIVEPNDPTALATEIANIIQNHTRLSALSEKALKRASGVSK